MTDKKKALEEIAEEIENCKVCKIGTSGKAVAGEGSPDAKVMFVGEAPGKTEARTGRPFVGRSGQLLRSTLKMLGINENEVFITSPVKYLPDRKTPSKSQIKHGNEHLHKQIDVIGPKIIVLLGNTACTALLNSKTPILKNHGKVTVQNARKYLITLHPSAVLRFPHKFKHLFISDLKRLRD